MKKIIIMFLILLIPLLPRADLTPEQQDDIASFSKNMILKGNGNEHRQGSFGILAYNQGTRKEGFNNQLSYMSRDYQSVNQINARKWTFDCSSFAAYVYYHCFGINTTYGSGNPYVVSKFVEDAHSKRYFYFIMNNVKVSSIDFSRMQKGDLVIIVGSHIMVYIGDGNIAHFSSSAIQKGSNLGSEVVKLKDKYPNNKVSVIRLKDGVIPTTKKANTIIKWPDTGKTEDLSDKDDKPVIKITKKDFHDNQLEITITMTDDKGLTGYQITQTNPTGYKSINRLKTYTTKEIIKDNGTYYIYAKDTKGQITKYEFIVSNIDDDKPVITKVSYQYHYSTNNFDIEITAIDKNKIMYSLDNSQYQDSNKFSNVSFGEHTIKVVDTANNVTEYILNLPNDLIPTININYSTEYTKNLIVTINATDTEGIIGYNVTRNNQEPTSFNSYTNNMTYNITSNGTYYFWIKTTRGIITNKSITINNIDNIPPTITNVNITRNFSSYNIEIEASDNECGISSYSIDGTSYQESNIFNNVETVNENIYVKDKCDNIAIYKVDLNNLPSIDYSTILLIICIIIVIVIIFMNISSIKKKRR
jgi:cell wall-associated NlpC family hydrolase